VLQAQNTKVSFTANEKFLVGVRLFRPVNMLDITAASLEGITVQQVSSSHLDFCWAHCGEGAWSPELPRATWSRSNSGDFSFFSPICGATRFFCESEDQARSEAHRAEAAARHQGRSKYLREKMGGSSRGFVLGAY